jgi:peptidoglycan hydrolase-like protein with peptidoglycan-binding domain
MAIWKPGHIAYIGEGLKIYEAANTASDMKVTEFGRRAGVFQELLIVSGSALAEDAGNTAAREENPYTQPTTTLCKGSTGEEVKWLQQELNEAGYGLEVDGEFGSKTLEAVKAFQQSCKIKVDGMVGPITRQCLIAN